MRPCAQATWAILTEPMGLPIGVYWWHAGPLDPWHRGIRWAMFATRQEAREHAAKVRRSYLRARVVRVTVSMADW